MPLHSPDLARRLAELLVARGADLNHRDSEGLTPLHQAVLEDQGDLAGWLVWGADPDIWAAAALGLRDHVESFLAGSPGLLSAAKAPIGQPQMTNAQAPMTNQTASGNDR